MCVHKNDDREMVEMRVAKKAYSAREDDEDARNGE